MTRVQLGFTDPGKRFSESAANRASRQLELRRGLRNPFFNRAEIIARDLEHHGRRGQLIGRADSIKC